MFIFEKENTERVGFFVKERGDGNSELNLRRYFSWRELFLNLEIVNKIMGSFVILLVFGFEDI